MTDLQERALAEIRSGKRFNGKLYGDSVYIGGHKWEVNGKKGRATIGEFLTAASNKFDTGVGYFGTAKDAARGFDGIETI
jgi:hypothetical protein